MSPTFNDITNLLNSLVNNDPHLDDGSPHQAFWQGVTEAEFVAMPTDDWGIQGPLVVPGNPTSSTLYKALAGATPFDGTMFQQMPDLGKDAGGRTATPQELSMVSTWIKNLQAKPK